MVTGVVLGDLIKLNSNNPDELEQIKISFTKRPKYYKFSKMYKNRIWNGDIKFMDYRNTIPIGLWNKLLNVCKKYNIELDIEGLYLIKNKHFNEDEFLERLNTFKKDKIEIRDYQLDAVKKVLSFYRSRCEVATAGGKTLIMYLIYDFLKYKDLIKKCLIIVPNISLVEQTKKYFKDYRMSFEPDSKNRIKISTLYSGSDYFNDYEILIGTYQSLVKKDQAFFKDINCVIIDEAHKSNANSIRKILKNLKNCKYFYGVSGTMLDDDSIEDFSLTSNLGPIVNKISAEKLIKLGYVTNVFIKIIRLKYLEQEKIDALYNYRKMVNKSVYGKKLLDLERSFIYENEKRLKFIARLILNFKNNSLILFNDVKNGYGRRLYDYLRECQSDKVFYYIDGNTDSDVRNEIIKIMEDGNNKILIASYGTFSTGISINNLHNIVFTESFKSEFLIRQSIGRGMRLYNNKNVVKIYDIVDDFVYKNNYNYMMKHHLKRLEIYKSQNFNHKIYNVDLNNFKF